MYVIENLEKKRKITAMQYEKAIIEYNYGVTSKLDVKAIRKLANKRDTAKFSMQFYRDYSK